MFIAAYASWPPHDDNQLYIRREAILTLKLHTTRREYLATVFTGGEPQTVFVQRADVESMLED